jgi:hypothetical protein
MAKMGCGLALFDGRNFSYWKSQMGAYLDALCPDVWNATKTGYTGALTPEQQKWNAKARNAIIEGISEDIFARIDNIDLAHDMWLQLIQLHEGSSKVREQKYYLLRAKYKYDEFKMLPNECCNDMFSRLNLIVKELNSLNVSNLDKGMINRKILMLLPKPKYNIINSMLQKEDFDEMEVVELVGEIRAHEMCSWHIRGTYHKQIHCFQGQCQEDPQVQDDQA